MSDFFRKNNIHIVSLLLFILFFVIFFYTIYVFRSQDTVSKAWSVKNPSFPPVRIEAKAAIVYDIQSNTVLYELHKDKVFPLASLTKLMTAFAISHIPFTLENISLIQKDIGIYSTQLLKAHDKVSADDLSKLMLVVSANEAAEALTRLIENKKKKSDFVFLDKQKTFVDYMNNIAKQYKLDSLYFLNATGLDIISSSSKPQSGAQGSAYDIAKLFTLLIKRDSNAVTATREDTAKVYNASKIIVAQNTNTHLGEIPHILASKTGYTDTAGGNLAIITDIELGHPIVIVVLHSSKEGRFKDVTTLYQATNTYIQSKNKVQ